MFGGIKKVPTTCPHCGFDQLEPRELISTYCRNCGDHYTVVHEALPREQPAPSIGEKLRARLRGSDHRRVTCFACESVHTVSSTCDATQCPTCNTAISLSDVSIVTHSTRAIDTRGTVHVARDAYLNATNTICANAFVEGRIAGRVQCSGTLRLRGTGLCRAQVSTVRLIIDRGASLRFSHPIVAEEILIRGRIEADIQCPGTIRVGRHGSLAGDVQARSLIVDKGGDYLGSVQVTASWIEPESRGRSEEFPRLEVVPAWRTRLSFAF